MIKRLKKFYNRHFVKKTNPNVSFGSISTSGIFRKGYVDGNGEMRFEHFGENVDVTKTEFYTTVDLEHRYNIISKGLFKETQIFPQESSFTVAIYKETNTVTGNRKYYFNHENKRMWVNSDVLEKTGDVIVIC